MDRYSIYFFEVLNSTNTFSKELIKNSIVNVNTPNIIIANKQMSGRGKLNAKFYSNTPNGLWFSIISKIFIDIKYLPLITIYTGYVVKKTIEELYPNLKGKIILKLPNDIYINNKKICGILTEAFNNFLIIGIGINVNHTREDFNEKIKDIASSLYIETNKKIDKFIILKKILKNFSFNINLIEFFNKNHINVLFKNKIIEIHKVKNFEFITTDGKKIKWIEI